MFQSKSVWFFALLASSANVSLAAISEDGICRANCTDDVCTFTAKVNLYAGELGYFQFDECEGALSPTLGMEIGKTYNFIQADRTNYFHPLGFAYFPDGDHAGADELEPGIVPPGSSSDCATNMTCPAPMYLQDGEYLGTYSNDATVATPSSGEDNFGLDDYEPKFFHPMPEWSSYGNFSISLKFTVEDYERDIFYFCHVSPNPFPDPWLLFQISQILFGLFLKIHQFMTGRIKLLKNDVQIQPNEDLPELGYQYDFEDNGLSEFDEQCGTFGLDDFQLPHLECPSKFVCDVPEESRQIAQFSTCIDAMDCFMVAGMTTGVKANSVVALFIHQMIPHHQNAVNMAKALLKTGELNCDNLEDETDDCVMETILYDIVNGQNAQIQSMRAILEGENYPPVDDCKVNIMLETTNGEATKYYTSSAENQSFAATISVVFIIAGLVASIML
jgi:hypothetical protein